MKKNKQAIGSNTQDRQALSRRNFLAGTALIGAGMAVGPLARAASADHAFSQIKVHGNRMNEMQMQVVEQ